MKKSSVILCLFLIILQIFQVNNAIGSRFSNTFSYNSFSKIPLYKFHIYFLIDVQKLGTEINGSTCQYPIYFSDKNNGLIYFVEYKNNTNISLGKKEFFFSKFDSTTLLWTKPINISKEYSKFCEENKIMEVREIFISTDNDLYVINLKNKEFSLQKLNINTKYIETNPCLSPDRNTLYFISDRKGGSGGKDIYASERLSDGNWSEPYNLGKTINTNEDEETPFIMLDNATLYFSSKGHGSYGGYDIFMSTINEEGYWSKPENIERPVNSEFDDYYYLTDSFGQKAYYSSDKLKKGNQDIFYVKYNSEGK